MLGFLICTIWFLLYTAPVWMFILGAIIFVKWFKKHKDDPIHPDIIYGSGVIRFK